MSHQHWSNYWQSGAQTSLPQDFKHNYDGEIYDKWTQVVDDLASGSQVTDVCTGNGAVALLLAEIALKQNKRLKITAIDISQINTKSIHQNNPAEQTKMIEFISNSPIEQLDSMLTEKQDAIVSQFGLEYSDVSVTAKTFTRCLKPNARLSFIAHSHDSAVFDYMASEQAIYNWLQDIGLFDLIKRFIQSHESVNGLKNKIMSIVQNNQPNPKFMSHGLFQSWQSTLTQLIKQPNQQLKNQKQSLGQYISEHQLAWQRLEDMLNVSSKVAEKNWYQPFTNVGFTLTHSDKIYYQGKHLIGQYYDFRY